LLSLAARFARVPIGWNAVKETSAGKNIDKRATGVAAAKLLTCRASFAKLG